MGPFIKSILQILNKGEKVKLCIHIILDLVIAMLDILFLGLLLLIINFYAKNANTPNTLLSQILSKSNPILFIGCFFVFYAVKNWFGFLISKNENIYCYAVASRLSERNIGQYLNGSYDNFVHTDSSVYIRKISQQPIEFSNYILTNLQQIISQSILILFTIIGILFYHPALFLSLFLLLIPPVTILGYIIKKRLSQVRSNTKLTSQLTLQYLKESLSGYVEGNIYGANSFFTRRYYDQQKSLNDNIATMQTLQGMPSRLIEVFAVLGFFILITIKYFSADHNSLNLLDIGVFMAASYKIIPGIVKILNCSGQMKTYKFTLDDLSESSIVNRPVASQKSFIESMTFNKVSFCYKEDPILTDFSLHISKGDFIGIYGPSGLGKTTIINLLTGFLTPQSGHIIINNVQTDTATRRHYWNRVSYVKQQPFFINDTIVKNITLTGEGYDTAKLNEVISFCGLQLMIGQSVEGINKIVTEDGKNISGGQRQRLMLARALYHDFDLLILDEPFSELDETSEKEILSKLREFTKQGKMIMMITHNQTSLSFCNQVIALNEK